MTVAEAEDEYLKAVRLGQKECAVLQGKGQNPFPVVLDQILGDGVSEGAQSWREKRGENFRFFGGLFSVAGLRVGIRNEVDDAVPGASGGRGHPRPHYLL